MTSITLVSSLLAVVVSFIGLAFSYQANELALEQYRQARLLVLTANFDKENDFDILVEPVDDKAHFMKGQVTFPSSISEEPSPIDSKGRVFYMGTISHNIKEAFLKDTKPEDGVYKMATQEIPIIVKSYYVSNGVSYTDTSLYLLGVQLTLMDDEYSYPTIEYSSFSFISRYKNEDDITVKVLDKILSGEYVIRLPGAVL
ncbi:hypothetical protein HUO05_06430 [Vibrio alginolyticus]|uniref:hypothetical protein n=1 Tax=Vibrio alginolyticus TaxID=663 RepID=UPI001592EF74|nr:hypothetical protein [Vibrio alginolyticus]EJG0029115.1 hypothetical protein [Vibrio alginolyticus]EJT1897063.1 hypothetical protein [Vibrio alginolyticus]ELB2899238.1 hypothetical protein [Vibrio alginolyticus]ELK2080011.1 hypothetical protein [Vibrio alginolyticus]EMA2429564.1 hypothetical protein [Vibrio alginolyticus]